MSDFLQRLKERKLVQWALAARLENDVARQPDSLILLQQISWIDVCLGRNAAAVAAARHAAELRPIEKDAYDGPNELSGLAQIEAFAGSKDEALRLIRQLLDIPAGNVMSIERLKRDPVWDPLRDDPRFVELTQLPVAGNKGTGR